MSSWFVSDISLLFTDLIVLQHYIRDHLLALLGIKDLKYIADAKGQCIISEEENKSFNRELPGSIKITMNNFRLDLTRSCSTLFNRTAMEVFTADFYQEVTVNHWYNSPPIPLQYLQLEFIGDCFYEHLEYVKLHYKVLVVDMANSFVVTQVKEGKRLQMVSRGVRKGRVSIPVGGWRQACADLMFSCSSINSISTPLLEIHS